MAVSAEQLRDKLAKDLEATHVEVEDKSGGCGSSFEVLVVSPKFAGLAMLARHRSVNHCLQLLCLARHYQFPNCSLFLQRHVCLLESFYWR